MSPPMEMAAIMMTICHIGMPYGADSSASPPAGPVGSRALGAGAALTSPGSSPSSTRTVKEKAMR